MILNLIDIATTLYIVSHGGIEVNPFMAYAIELGIFPLLKLTVGTWCFWWLRRNSKVLYGVMCGVYAMIIINNLITIGVLLK